MLADFRRCCCGLATSVATECRYGCKFLEISGVFYKLIGTCRGIRDQSSAGSRAARSSAGYQTPESNTRIFTKRGCKGASRRSNDDRSHDISRPGMPPIAMHHWKEISLKTKRPKNSGKISSNFLWSYVADGSAIVAVFIAALAARAYDRVSDVASHALQAANRANFLRSRAKMSCRLIFRSNDAFCSLAWLRCPSSECVFLTTPAVKGASARP